AMAYKRNPMRSERVCSLARYVMSMTDNAANTHANQWFERTLDDSANRRLSLPEAFLGVDVVLNLCSNIIDGIRVWPLVIRKRIDTFLPFMATENILMACVKAGGDRQDLHEVIREHSVETAEDMKELGKDNDLLDRLKADPRFAAVKHVLDDFSQIADPAEFVGRAPQQVVEFIEAEVDPCMEKFADLDTGERSELSV
ncbi:MAG: adenylosuccinate lyase, partial [Planctomycetes bacterium]|nr:adenylosuccinate lyase [Planctomycetota bacterium]